MAAPSLTTAYVGIQRSSSIDEARPPDAAPAEMRRRASPPSSPIVSAPPTLQVPPDSTAAAATSTTTTGNFFNHFFHSFHFYSNFLSFFLTPTPLEMIPLAPACSFAGFTSSIFFNFLEKKRAFSPTYICVKNDR